MYKYNLKRAALRTINICFELFHYAPPYKNWDTSKVNPNGSPVAILELNDQFPSELQDTFTLPSGPDSTGVSRSLSNWITSSWPIVSLSHALAPIHRTRMYRRLRVCRFRNSKRPSTVSVHTAAIDQNQPCCRTLLAK